jgi:intracellular sulfur oxidation DsrE/DsrF family protein
MQSRRTFFGGSALALAAAQVAAVTGARAATSGPYDFGAIEQRLNLPFRHRQAFGSHALADGAATALMVNSLNAYEFDYGEGPGTLHALGVFYGTAVRYSSTTPGGKNTRSTSFNSGAATRPSAPFPAAAIRTRTRPRRSIPRALRADIHGFYHDTSLAALAKRKASFFACDNALRGLATDIAVSYGMSDEPMGSVHADLRARLLPGTFLVPAGVASINQAQEMKFTFMPASV